MCSFFCFLFLFVSDGGITVYSQILLSGSLVLASLFLLWLFLSAAISGLLTLFGLLALSLLAVLGLVFLWRLGLLLLGHFGVQLLQLLHLAHHVRCFHNWVSVLRLLLLLLDLSLEPLPYLVDFVRDILQFLVGEPWFGFGELGNLLAVKVEGFNRCFLELVLLLVPSFTVVEFGELLL